MTVLPLGVAVKQGIGVAFSEWAGVEMEILVIGGQNRKFKL